MTSFEEAVTLVAGAVNSHETMSTTAAVANETGLPADLVIRILDILERIGDVRRYDTTINSEPLALWGRP
jgi:hypothetical protein